MWLFLCISLYVHPRDIGIELLVQLAHSGERNRTKLVINSQVWPLDTGAEPQNTADYNFGAQGFGGNESGSGFMERTQ